MDHNFWTVTPKCRAGLRITEDMNLVSPAPVGLDCWQFGGNIVRDPGVNTGTDPGVNTVTCLYVHMLE